MLGALREKIDSYRTPENIEDPFPADFSFIDAEGEDSYLSYKFLTEVDYPQEEKILLDENVIFDHLENTNRVVEAYLDDSEVAKMMTVLGYEPKRENITKSGQYHYTEDFSGQEIEEMLQLAYDQDFEIYYVDQVDEILNRNGFEEEDVERYLKELDLIAEPVEIEPITDKVMMDSAIALKADQENMNIVTSDVDFIENPHLGMEFTDNSVYTPHQMKQRLELVQKLQSD